MPISMPATKQLMKASVYTQYGPPEVLQLQEVAKPLPKENEVQIRIYATAVSSGDWHMRKADPLVIRLFSGLFRPKQPILGYVLAGEVKSIGKAVSRFSPGDQVYGTTGMRFGAYAEYICLPEDAVLAEKPASMNYEEAAAIPFGGNTALYFLRKANIQPGQKVLIYGASGAVGTAAVQLCASFGAQVTGVCSTGNMAMVSSLGANSVIDYTQEDFTQNGETYDVIFDTVGKSSFSNSLKSLAPTGHYLLAAGGVAEMIRGAWHSLISKQTVVSGVMSETTEDLLFFNELIATGQVKAVIDRSYPLADIAQAHSYVEKGHKKGNVVVRV